MPSERAGGAGPVGLAEAPCEGGVPLGGEPSACVVCAEEPGGYLRIVLWGEPDRGARAKAGDERY